MRRRRSGEKYRSPDEDDFSSEDGGPPAAFRMTIFPDGNREGKIIDKNLINEVKLKDEMYMIAVIGN